MTISSPSSTTATSLGDRVLQAIKNASAKVGVDFDYMVKKAEQESGLNPNAKASSSSATGLYQFIDQTWLRMVKTYGAKYGLASAAEKIVLGSDGVARVKDSQSKQDILALRKDPSLSADMAAELASQNKTELQQEVGGKIGNTELYLAHFLGASGASDFLKAMKSNPDENAAAVLPQAARANKSVFYDKAGKAKSLGEVYDHFASKFDGASSTRSYASLRGSSFARIASASSSYGLSSSGGGSSASAFSSTGFATLSPSNIASPYTAMLLAQGTLQDTTSKTFSSLAAYSSDREKRRDGALFGTSA